ncbi:MAG: hypothetical protein ABTS16_16580, partial [Candidatus Accumulibacter phosphatis]
MSIPAIEIGVPFARFGRVKEEALPVVQQAAPGSGLFSGPAKQATAVVVRNLNSTLTDSNGIFGCWRLPS